MTDPAAPGLALDVADGVAVLTLAYPPFNLVGGPMLTDIAAAQAALADDPAVRVILLQSGIDGVFCLHGDVARVGDLVAVLQGEDGRESGIAAVRARVAPLYAILDRFAAMPQIVIAKIAGLCRGGGLELALACDMRFAASAISRLGQPEVGMGIVPGGGGTTRLPALLGRARALEVLVGSADLSAEEAEWLGLINRALPGDELDSYVNRLARHIADQPGYAVAAVKAAVNANLPKPDYEAEIAATFATMGHAETPDYVRGVMAAGMQASLAAEWDLDAVAAEGRRRARASRT